MRDGLLKKGFMGVAGVLDRRFGWSHLPKPVAMATLMGLRMVLRRHNLFDPSGETVGWGPEQPPPGPRILVRTVDGTGTDPIRPDMGRAGMPFGRNVPIEDTYPLDLLKPNPRTVSNELLARKEFIPATTLNVLAAAWIQFEVHDWMSHGTNDRKDPWEVELEETDHFPQHPMQIRRTHVAEPTTDGRPPTYSNTETHWWDASQVYTSSPVTQKMLRTHQGGHLVLDSRGVIPFDPPNMKDLPPDVAGVTGNWWLGLAMLHTLFMKEHNSICDHLAGVHPTWDDQELFDRARLINAALMAKIHTIEWTPALLADSVMETGMKWNWWGMQGEQLSKRVGRLTKSEEVSGIPGSELYYHGAPFAMTEEFVAVYRMHPLIPDDYLIRSWTDDNLIQAVKFKELAGRQTINILNDTQIGMPDLFYSFGTSYPGQIVLHNFPEQLRCFDEPDPVDGTITVDLAAIDILRSRERGVPRYNEFRRKFHMKPAGRFEDFSDDPGVVEDLRRIYGDPEAVDLMVGLYAEKPPDGFAFSDTAFRVFIVMASRRLKSDRFYTYDYRPEVYTREGMRWIEDNTMKSVILRHYPNLADALAGVDNAFKPWNAAARS